MDYGGHSLGGVVAIKAILNDPDLYTGLVLLASYPAGKDDLSLWTGAVLSISAENDKLTIPKDIDDSKKLLPKANEITCDTELGDLPTPGQTIFYEISGGNHAQFGDYGEQKDDGIASISMEEQHDQIVNLISIFFEVNKW